MIRTAVVDLGSNTCTLAVYDLTADGGIDRIAQFGEPLKLMRRLGPDRRLPAAAIERTVEVLLGFGARARELGAPLEVVATSAVRDAVNQEDLLGRIRQQFPVRLIDGELEGVYAGLAVTNTLPVSDGFVVDQGGGSMQVVHLTTRRSRQVSSLPLGALRLADTWLGEPLKPPAITALRRHLQDQLGGLGWFRATAGGELVAVGGSARALAKIDRRLRGWPVRAGHGYRLTIDAVEALWEQLSRMTPEERREVPGLAAHRVDTIVAAAFTWFVLLRITGFDAARICTYGIREGVAFRRALDADALVPDVRLAGLTIRFPGRSPAQIARARALGQDGGEPRWASALFIAAWVGPRDAYKLLEWPLAGYWQEDVLAAYELLSDGPTRTMPEVVRRRLRARLDAES